jgi:hypothetical protein
MPRFRCLPLLAALALSAAGCGRQSAPPAAQVPAAPSAAGVDAPTAPVPLQDVVETTPDYIIGISYPKAAARHPGLAKALQAYADAARAELLQAVSGLRGRKPSVPYDLSLQFTTLVDTPKIVAVAADGSSYTGGAHGNPLVERFTWLPEPQRMLTADRLLASPDGWEVIARACREQLATALAQRLDADRLEGGERAAQLGNGTRMIDDGTQPRAENFSRFEPIVDADGRIRALRFVFPPYQVAPYSEGTRTADVPAATLLPLLAADVRPLFRGG